MKAPNPQQQTKKKQRSSWLFPVLCQLCYDVFKDLLPELGILATFRVAMINVAIIKKRQRGWWWS